MRPEVFEGRRKGARFDRYMNNLERLVERFAANTGAGAPPIHDVTVALRPNIEEIPALVVKKTFCRSSGGVRSSRSMNCGWIVGLYRQEKKKWPSSTSGRRLMTLAKISFVIKWFLMPAKSQKPSAVKHRPGLFPRASRAPGQDLSGPGLFSRRASGTAAATPQRSQPNNAAPPRNNPE